MEKPLQVFLILLFLLVLNFKFLIFNLTYAVSINTCPVDLYLCGTPGPEPDAFYPYPGSSCYKNTKEPKVIINYGIEVQKLISLPYLSTQSGYTTYYNWNFTAKAEAENLKIPVVRQIADLFEGEEPFSRKISLDTNGNPILENFGPISKLIHYTPFQDKLKQIIAVSAIDSQYNPPSSTTQPREFAPNPLHDYIIAYAIPAAGHNPNASGPCNDKDWWYGGEEFKDNPLARPIRASEPDCTAFLKSGTVPFHSEANIKSQYAGIVCPKLYGNPLGAQNGLYVQKLKQEGKIWCPLSEQVLVEVWKKFMPLVSHETEPAEITLTFNGKPSGQGKIYLPHLARLEQLSSIFKEMHLPKFEQNLNTVYADVSQSVSIPNQELICPANIDLMPTPALGGGSFEVEVPPRPTTTPTPAFFDKTLKQQGTLQIAFPELLKIKENLVGDNGYFKAWLPKEVIQRIEQEIAQEGKASEGEGKIKINVSGADSVSPSEITVKYPFLNALNKYYQEFIKLLLPKITSYSSYQPIQPFSSPPPTQLTYSLPFKDSTFTISDSKKQEIINAVKSNPNWAATTQIETKWDLVYTQSKNHSWNPAFVIALWIEESGANAVGDYGLGCTAGSFEIESQLDCLFRNFDSETNFERFMCIYSEGHYPCEFRINPGFPERLKYWYNKITL